MASRMSNAEAGCCLMKVELDPAEAPRLGEDLGRHGDLADVVDETGQAQGGELLALHAHLPGDCRGQLRNAAFVARGIGVAGLDHEAHGQHRHTPVGRQKLRVGLADPRDDLGDLLAGDIPQPGERC